MTYRGEKSKITQNAQRIAEVGLGVIEIENAIENLYALGSIQARLMLGSYLAEAMLLAGRAKEVHVQMRHHSTLIQQSGQVGFLAQTRLMTARALLALSNPDPAEAEAELHRCLDCAREQGMKMIELRASIVLSRLWQEHGKAREAHCLLSSAYEWFCEGFDTHDLREASKRIEELTCAINDIARGSLEN